MRRNRSFVTAVAVTALVIGGSAAAGADESYQMPEDPTPVGDSECVPLPKEHALHADVSGFDETDDESVDDWAAELALDNHAGVGEGHQWFTIGIDDNSYGNSWAIEAMPVNIVDSSTTRRAFRLGTATYQWVDDSNWWLGAMWRFDNSIGNLPDRAEIPVPSAAVANPSVSIGVPFPVESAYIEGDAPGGGDSHYLAIDTDECASYETFVTKRPGAFGNLTSTVGGTPQTFEASMGSRWDLSSVSAAYRDPAATFGGLTYGYGTGTPFQNGVHVNGTSKHITTVPANRYRGADVAGFPMSAMVLRYEDISTHPLEHALRFAMPAEMVKNTPVWPAIYSDGTSSSADAAPMGTWLRLEVSDADLESRLGRSLTSLEENLTAGLRTHGMILSDSNGGGWEFAIDADDAWDDDFRDAVMALEFGDFTRLVDADDMRASSGSISSTYSTWFEID